ncbi:MAG: type II toxin-antitoxin system HicB family antitoxin [Deltaproteobacteria bacterium]|nr:type II toxin-antitoxin system HicB family antitoxin [Deltaproteobacteria bacterium]
MVSRLINYQNYILFGGKLNFYVGTVPELKGCHTQAKSLDALLERIKEAIELCVEVEEVPIITEFVGFQRIAVPV